MDKDMGFKNIRNFHEKVNNIFHLTLALPLLPMGYIFLESNHDDFEPPLGENQLLVIASIISALLVTAFAYTHYQGNLEKVREEDGLAAQFRALYSQYQKLYLGNLAASLLLVVGYYLTGSDYVIGTYVLHLFTLSLIRPYYDRYSRDLKLSKEDALAVRKMTLAFEEDL
ncbi:hypothetical protein [Fulvivirga sedimenti]|uniref:Uncharacterized protein n=1 Tax=Fulvivirga sedimenti TaxID=2879465 RepID=A0A9X1KWY0_9BACT|nr:hypothetical protein [Fulvivirga sedimenti]MCA6075230.1 hypothetical protein [Fulvivirga sedimenti]MCA6076407.1 hypothetical protein [Fulvivirga sedimenti]MCA6077535.1 hypothetical protein [Fulvivirga sedimenti]